MSCNIRIETIKKWLAHADGYEETGNERDNIIYGEEAIMNKCCNTCITETEICPFGRMVGKHDWNLFHEYCSRYTKPEPDGKIKKLVVSNSLSNDIFNKINEIIDALNRRG